MEKVSRVLLGTQVIATDTGRSRGNCEGDSLALSKVSSRETEGLNQGGQAAKGAWRMPWR